MIELGASVTFPHGWVTGEPVAMKGFRIEAAGGRRMRTFSVFLDDGVTVLAMTYPGGVQYARITASSIEVRCDGDSGDDEVANLWAAWLDHWTTNVNDEGVSDE